MLELARLTTGLDDDELEHVHHLVASWQVLADLSFSDLLLLAPVAGEAGRTFVVLAQVRPTTGPTSYPADLVGRVVDEVERPLVGRTCRRSEITSGVAPLLDSTERARLQCVPVRQREHPVAVVSREAATALARRPGELERQYLDVFDRLARMIADGTFPFERGELELEDAPRVGDGVVVIDRDRRARFVSPNAMIALHRMGIHAYTTGQQLGDVGLDQSAVDAAFRSCRPVMVELQRGD